MGEKNLSIFLLLNPFSNVFKECEFVLIIGVKVFIWNKDLITNEFVMFKMRKFGFHLDNPILYQTFLIALSKENQ